MQYIRIIYKKYIDKRGILSQNLIKLVEKMTVINHLFCKKKNILNINMKYKYEIIKKIFKENN